MENLVKWTTDIQQDDRAIILEATTGLRKLLSIENNPPIQEVINSGVVPRLVTFLKMADYPAIQFEATWALTNITSGSSEQTNVVVQSGAIPLLIELLASPSVDVCDQACWALGNIAGDNNKLRDFLLGLGISHKLVALFDSDKTTILRNATWTMSNLCRGKPIPSFQHVNIFLPHILKFQNSNDEEILANVMWTMSYLSDGPNERIQAVIEAGLIQMALKFLNHASTISTPALRTLGNVVTGDDLQTQVVLNLGLLDIVQPTFASTKKGVVKELCWLISNITAGTKTQIQLVIDSGTFQKLVDILNNNSAPETKLEACWAISNATAGGSAEQLRTLYEIGCFASITNVLRDGQPKMINVALEGLENYFKVGEQNLDQNGRNFYVQEFYRLGGANFLETLEKAENNLYKEKVINLRKTFFPDTLKMIL